LSRGHGCPDAEAVLGSKDLAIEYLKKANEVVPISPQWMKNDGDLKSLRGDPRFASILADAGQRRAAQSSSH